MRRGRLDEASGEFGGRDAAGMVLMSGDMVSA